MPRQLFLSLATIAFVCSALVWHSSAALADTPASASESVRRYVSLLKDADALVRKRAALALKRLGSKAKAALPALEEALAAEADGDAGVRAAVAAALEAIDPAPARPVPVPTIVPPTRKAEEPPRPKSVKPLAPPPQSRKTPPQPPNAERAEIGSYFVDPKALPSILVGRKTDLDPWQRLRPGTRVAMGDKLVSLPGFISEIRLDSGVHLLLRGHVREFSLFPEMNYLQESAIVLHPREGADADLTLQRGRLYIFNHKAKETAVVRLRFEKQDWTLTLQPGAEVVVDLLKRYRGDVDYLKGEPPVTTLALFVLKGKAGLADGQQHFPALSAPPGPAAFLWGNKRPHAGLRGPSNKDSVPIFFRVVLPLDPKKNPDADKMAIALKTLNGRMLPDKNPIAVLNEELTKFDDPMRHRLAIYCLGGLDAINPLLDVLSDADVRHARQRNTAIFALHHWLAQDARNGLLLFDPKTKSGILTKGKMYNAGEAMRIFVLLHDFDEEQVFDVETYDKLARDLIGDKVAIAELARWHLYRLANFQGVKLPSLDRFNAADSREKRQLAYREVHDKIERGELPVRVPLDAAPNRNKR